jgi:hypothetical protein
MSAIRLMWWSGGLLILCAIVSLIMGNYSEVWRLAFGLASLTLGFVLGCNHVRDQHDARS